MGLIFFLAMLLLHREILEGGIILSGVTGDTKQTVTNENCSLIIAHRGSHLFSLENTPASTHQALMIGADGVELDVWIKNDTVSISHDPPKNPKTTSLDQYIQIIKSSSPPSKQFLFFLELKGYDPGPSSGCPLPNYQPMILSSFHSSILKNIERACPNIRFFFELNESYALLYYDRPLPENVSLSIPVSILGNPEAKPFIEEGKKNNGISVYTVRNLYQLYQALRYEIDFIQTDYPATGVLFRNILQTCQSSEEHLSGSF